MVPSNLRTLRIPPQHPHNAARFARGIVLSQKRLSQIGQHPPVSLCFLPLAPSFFPVPPCFWPSFLRLSLWGFRVQLRLFFVSLMLRRSLRFARSGGRMAAPPARPFCLRRMGGSGFFPGLSSLCGLKMPLDSAAAGYFLPLRPVPHRPGRGQKPPPPGPCSTGLISRSCAGQKIRTLPHPAPPLGECPSHQIASPPSGFRGLHSQTAWVVAVARAPVALSQKRATSRIRRFCVSRRRARTAL